MPVFLPEGETRQRAAMQIPAWQPSCSLGELADGAWWIPRRCKLGSKAPLEAMILAPHGVHGLPLRA